MIVDDGLFEFSKEPKNIYRYHCFDDPSSSEWLDGKEYIDYVILNEAEERNEVQEKRWNYFYRAYNYGDNIAPKQKELIKKINFRIDNYNIYRNASYVLTVLVLFGLIAKAFLSEVLAFSSISIPLFIISLILFFLYLVSCKLDKWAEEIIVLKKEIDFLLDQHRFLQENRMTSEEIEKEFWGDMRFLEDDYIKNVLKRSSRKEERDKYGFYETIRGNPLFEDINFPKYPVIPTWGILQKTHEENTTFRNPGVRKMLNDIGKRSATWRNVGNGKPFYRLWNINFIFFDDKSIDTISFYYDFITQKKYGENIETYYYSHIANCSYRPYDIDTDENSFIIQDINLPAVLEEHILDGEAYQLGFSSSSNKLYQCILPGKETTEGLKKWIVANEKEIEIKKFNIDDENANNKFNIEKELQEALTQHNELYSSLALEFLNVLRKKIEGFSINAKSVS